VDTFRNDGEERLRHRVPVALTGDSAKRAWLRLGGSLATMTFGAVMALTAQGNLFSLAFGVMIAVLALDGALGVLRNRFLPAVLITKRELCRRGDCRPFFELKAVSLAYRHPYLLRPDLLPELRLLLDWGDARWQVPLTHENWEVLWERLMGYRAEMPHWSRHPEVLRALAQSVEVPYYLPPGVETYPIEAPTWAKTIPGLIFGGALAAMYYFPATTRFLSNQTVFGLSAAVMFLIDRKLRKVRLEIRPAEPGWLRRRKVERGETRGGVSEGG